jgi:quinol monooxygenase YgiN
MDPKPLTLVVSFQARPGKEAALRALLAGMVAPTRAEPGCLNYDLHAAPDDPSKFMFHENWASREHHQAHDKTPHVAHLRSVIHELSFPASKSFWERIG